MVGEMKEERGACRVGNAFRMLICAKCRVWWLGRQVCAYKMVQCDLS